MYMLKKDVIKNKKKSELSLFDLLFVIDIAQPSKSLPGHKFLEHLNNTFIVNLPNQRYQDMNWTVLKQEKELCEFLLPLCN